MEELQLRHVPTVNGGWIFDWDMFSPCSHRKWRDDFQLGHMLTINKGGISSGTRSNLVLTINGGRNLDWDACSLEMEGGCLVAKRSYLVLAVNGW